MRRLFRLISFINFYCDYNHQLFILFNYVFSKYINNNFIRDYDINSKNLSFKREKLMKKANNLKK